MSLKDFVIIQKLGQGSYAQVFKARRLTDQKIYALKQIHINKLDEKQKKNALNQIRFLASFESRNIIKYYEAFFQQSISLLVIVMQYANEGDLSKLIEIKKAHKQKFYEVQIWKMMISLIHGLGYLHERSIIHRDIKPQNIFISEGQFKIGDLNVSKLKQANLQKLTQVGTPYYASPQVWQNSNYDHKCDVWSLGCVVYQMAALTPPFLASSMDKLYEQITKKKIKPIPKHYSNQLANIIYRCLQKQPKKRPTIKQLKQNFTIKMYQNLYYTSEQLQNQKNKYSNLLKTITLPKDKKLTQIQLPEPHYENVNKEKQKQMTNEIRTEFMKSIPIKIQSTQQIHIKSGKSHQIDESIQREKIFTNKYNQIQSKKNQNKIIQKAQKHQRIIQPVNKLSDCRLRLKSQVVCPKNSKSGRRLFKFDKKSNKINESKIKKQLDTKDKSQLSPLNQICNNNETPLKNKEEENKDAYEHKSMVKSRRSSPRTELSAKKIQVYKTQSQNSCSKNYSEPNLLKEKQNIKCKSNKDIQSILLLAKIPKNMMNVSQNLLCHRKQNLLHQLKSKQENVVNERFRKISEELKNQNRNKKAKPKIFINNQLQSALNSNELIRRVKQMHKSVNTKA